MQHFIRTTRIKRHHARLIEANKYALLDIIVRTISALGIVIIGAATWMLQDQAEQTRQDLLRRENESRIYLAQVRSLVNLEFALRDLAILASPANTAATRRSSDQVAFAARSLYSRHKQQEVSPNSIPELWRFWQLHEQPKSISLRAAALGLSEFSQIYTDER